MSSPHLLGPSGRPRVGDHPVSRSSVRRVWVGLPGSWRGYFPAPPRPSSSPPPPQPAVDRNNPRSRASRFLKMKRDSRSAPLRWKPSLQKVRETNWDLGPVVPTHMSKRWLQRPNLTSKMTELDLDLLSYLLMFHLHWHSNCERFDTSFGAESKPNGFSQLLPASLGSAPTRRLLAFCIESRPGT